MHMTIYGMGGDAMDNKNIFAANLKYHMEQNKKTRRDICAALGFSYYTFSDWVNGKKYPRMDKVEMLADYFGIQKSDLIEERKEKPAEDDGASANRRALREFVELVPEDKAEMILRVMRTIVESD